MLSYLEHIVRVVYLQSIFQHITFCDNVFRETYVVIHERFGLLSISASDALQPQTHITERPPVVPTMMTKAERKRLQWEKEKGIFIGTILRMGILI